MALGGESMTIRRTSGENDSAGVDRCGGVRRLGRWGVAAADSAFPPSFPPDQNQLPKLPSEPQLYDMLPIPTAGRRPVV